MKDIKNNARNKRRGFTLTELIIVIAIIVILAGVSVPFIVQYVESAKQLSRMNTARTLYLAAQNKLTEYKITGHLKEFSNVFYSDYENDSLNDTALVYDALGAHPTGDEATNESYVRYMSKTSGTYDETNPVIQLLAGSVLDKEVLTKAILVEYNIKTGIVLSVFYSDTVNALVYGGSDDKANVRGARPYTDYETRKQGYYGAAGTGEQTADTTPSVINIYDGAQNGRALRLDSQTETNAVLYAELLVHEDKLTQGNFKLQLYAADGTTLLFESAPVTLNGLSKNLTQALAFALNSPHILYDDTDAYNAAQIASGNEGLEAGYHRIIWVLDYVYGDMTATPQYSIGVKYGAALTDASSPVRAGIESEDGYGAASVSLTQAYPYYSGNTDAGAYNVCSARHLYNIRYNPSASFIQTADIDMRIMGQPRNMAPLSIAYSAYPVVNNVNIDYSAGAAQALSPVDFSGKYVVSGNSKLSYLVITDTSLENVGLFGSVSASAAIDNIQLEYAAISGKQTAGAIAGANNGKLTGINIINSTVAGERTAGGLSGINGSSALISDCIFMSSTSTAPVSTGSSGTAGGITGSNAGQLSRVFYLAVAPVKSNKCYPITYTNSGGFTNALYLSGIVIRPNINPASYNMLEATVGKPLGTDGFYELTLNDGSYIGYSRNTVTDPLELALTTTKYPYPYFGGATPIADGYDWPVVRGNISIPTYYEKYDDNTYGFYYYDTRVLINGKPKLVKTIKPYSDEEPFRVTEAGYGVLSNNKNNVTIRWNSVNYTNISPLTVAIDETNAQYSLYVFKPTQAQLGSSLIPKTITFDGVEIKDIYCLPHFARGLYLKNEEVKFNYIRTPAQMYNITLVATNTNEKTFYQELDLDFSASNAAIGGKSTFDNSPVSAAFYGTYDGSNRTVTNLTISAAQQQLGLFSTNGGTIKNITLSNTSITNNAPRVSSTRTASVGGIAGVCLNGAKLYGCRVDNTCSISNNSTNAQTGTGGIIGLCGTTSSDSAQLMLYNSCSGATVTGSRNTGGVVGLMYYAMSTCYNTGTITSGASSGDVGGVVGSTSAPVSNCYNAGTVSCTYSSTDTGGVAGYLGAGITDSYNIGNVTATYGSVGGIAGYGVGNIANCYNTGIITTSNTYCGGIIGNTSSVTISNCNNTGTIAGDTENYIGGIAGMLRGSITYCNNSGAITAGTYNGGIAGYSDGSDIDYCYNTGSVAGRSTYTGGISGYATNTQIQYCYNTGSLSASSYAGGIAGMMINGTGVLCSYNIGSVYASSSYAGGIVGQERTNTTMNVCYSVGTVSGNSTGMLIGYLNCTKTQAQSLGMDSCYAIDNHNATALIANYSSLSGGTTYTADRWGNNSMVSENWIKSITTQTNPVYPQLGLVAFADPQYMWTLAPTTSVNGGFPINKVFGYTGSTTGLDAFKLDTTDGAYIVSNAYQLDLMRNYATRTDLTFKLDRNICLGGVSWTPIGTLASPFKPVFDGEGFSITGLYVNASSSDYQGLFGYKSDGAIKNLSVSGSVTGRNYVGGIAGFSTAGMEYCYNLASVSGANCAGGVAGHIDGFSGYVYNNGRITCSGVAGGVFGESAGAGSEYAYNTGAVTGAVAVGGAIGRMFDTALYNAYNAGTVSGSGYKGNLVGASYGTLVTGNYDLRYHFGVNAALPDDLKSDVQRFTAYWEKYEITQNNTTSEAYGFYYYNGAALTNTLITPDDETTLVDAGYGVLSAGLAPQSTIGWNNNTYANITPKYNVCTLAGASMNLYAFEPTDEQLASATLSAVKFNDETLYGYCLPLFAKGVYASSTPVAEYRIRTPWQLININRLSETSGLTFTQELPLDFSAANYTLGGGNLTVSAVHIAFNGYYNGAGKPITGLCITSSEASAGLFSQNSGTIENVVLEGALITSTAGTESYTGGIAGTSAAGSRITGCIFASSIGAPASVSGNGEIGAIVGAITGQDGSTTTVSGCAVIGYVTISGGSQATVGGIAGSADAYSVLEDVCVTAASLTSPVTGGTVHGGIIGRSTGMVTRAVYIAVAPSSGDPLTSYPIVGSGAAGAECYYLTGTDYKLNTDAAWTSSALNSEPCAGGGTGKDAAWFAAAELATSYGSDWSSSWQTATDYPYPLPISAAAAPDVYIQAQP